MVFCVLFAIVAGGLTIGGSNGDEYPTPPADVDALPTVKKVYIPIIPDFTNDEAIEKFKELWTAQTDYLRTIKQAAEEVSRVTEHQIRQFGWIVNDTEARIEQQISILSKSPREYTEAMREALDDDTVFLQRKSWDALERCLNDHYEFDEKDEHEQLFRKTLETARDDLTRRQKEIKSMVAAKQHEKSVKS